MTDHELAERLRKRGWTGKVRRLPPPARDMCTTEFVHPSGTVLCTLDIDNCTCTWSIRSAVWEGGE